MDAAQMGIKRGQLREVNMRIEWKESIRGHSYVSTNTICHLQLCLSKDEWLICTDNGIFHTGTSYLEIAIVRALSKYKEILAKEIDKFNI